MKKTFLLLVSSLAIVLSIAACIEPYELRFDTTKQIIIVDGSLNDDPLQLQTVSIKIAMPSIAGLGYFVPIKQAKVELMADGKVSTVLAEGTDNLYYLSPDYKLLPKVKYSIKITTSDGKIYESGQESMELINPIDKVYKNLEMKGIDRGNTSIPAHYVYIDTKDPAGVNNSYLWRWKLWEKQSVCESCAGGRYNTNRRAGTIGCLRDNALEAAGVVYDYGCLTSCWEIIYNPDINVMTDTYVDGKEIKGRLVAKIPIYQNRGALLEIQQESVSPSAFRYLKLLIEQSQTTGSLADTPPAALVGNIRCLTDPTESVAGYFMVSSVKKQLYWIDRLDAETIAPLGLLGGRGINFEPAAAGATDRPPLLPCVNSKTRTSNRPPSWVD